MLIFPLNLDLLTYIMLSYMLIAKDLTTRIGPLAAKLISPIYCHMSLIDGLLKRIIIYQELLHSLVYLFI